VNRNPYAARLAQRRRRKSGDLHALVKAVWQAIRDCETALESAETNEERCRSIHAMAAIANSYVKLLQIGEYEARLTAIEAIVKEQHRDT
jgi:hypothetical protein